MASDVASADAERKPDTRPPATEPKPDGAAATPAAPAGGGGLGERQVQAKAGNAALGAVDDPAERAADAAADRVMRMPERASEPAVPDPAAPAVAPDTTTPAGVPGPARSGTPAPEPEPPAPEGQAPSRETPRVPDAVQEYLDASRGQGAPLPEAARATFESAFRRPLDDVRIHDDASADHAARSIDALAFTRGTDIYFRSGAFDPTGPEGKRLLAHELAHVVQQRPGINRRATPGLGGAVVRRVPKKGATSTKASASEPPEVVVPDADRKPTRTTTADPIGTIDTNGHPKGTLTINEVVFPQWKADVVGTKPLRWRRTKRPATKQREVWEAAVLTDTVKAVTAHLPKIGGAQPADRPYIVKSGTAAPFDYHIGSPEVIARRVLRPTWTRVGGAYRRFDVDHKRDWQLGGEDDIANLWLFDAHKNRSAGSVMNNAMRNRVIQFLGQAGPYLKPRPTAAEVLEGYEIIFAKPVGAGDAANADDSWEKGHIGKDEHMAGLKEVDGTEREEISGSKTELRIFNDVSGGRYRPLPIDKSGKVTEPKWQKKVGKRQFFEVRDVTFISPGPTGGTGVVGKVSGVAFRNGDLVELPPFHVDLLGMPGLPFAAHLAKPDLQNIRATLKQLSPIAFTDLAFDVTDGFVGRGVVRPGSRLLADADIGLVLDAAGIGIQATILGGDLALPGPLKVTGGSLSLAAGTGGLAVEGRVDFGIEKLATGFIAATAAAKDGHPSFELAGGLIFDRRLFTKAELGLSFKDGKWGVQGELGIGPGKVKGIKQASATVQVTDDTVTATGEFETSLKGVDKGTLGLVYGPATGMTISGEILLGQGIPGIRGGRLAATVREGAEGWSLAGSVTAEPAVPGMTGTITGSYADGAFGVEADLGYERGLAKGSVRAGLTNRTLDAEGRPTGPIAKDGALTAYGGGTVTLTITPWLQGTVGLRLTPAGEIEVTGKVALPSTFEVFPEKKVEREVVSIGFDLPIVGVAVAGQRIGIFATIGGGVRIAAGFGPGRLQDVSLAVTYRPDRPDDTTVTGSGTFVVPAQARLRVEAQGALGVGIPVVSAKAGVAVFGEVGLSGAGSGSSTINWTPRTGIVLDARGEVVAEPRFRFGVDAFVDVTADLWLTEIELYKRTWNLASFEYGSALRFGMAFPLHYESGKPFDLSFDQIQWTYPQINPRELLGGLMAQLVG